MKPPPTTCMPEMRADVKTTIVAAVLVCVECSYLAWDGVWMGASDWGTIFMLPLIVACWVAVLSTSLLTVRHLICDERHLSLRAGLHAVTLAAIAGALCCSRGLISITTCPLLPAISTHRVFGDSLQPWAMRLLAQPEARILRDPEMAAVVDKKKPVREDLALRAIRDDKVRRPHVYVVYLTPAPYSSEGSSVGSNERHIEVYLRTPKVGGMAIGGPSFRAWGTRHTQVLMVSRGVYLWQTDGP